MDSFNTVWKVNKRALDFDLKGLGHDWGQCLFTKILTWNSYRILTESHPKMYKPFWKGLNNKQS